jgi:divalent metal cation (Fe/Co/Zn/Cd) transporter
VDRDSTSRDVDWPRIALWLVGATLAYNTVEAGVAIWSGIRAGSIALVGFGLDSIIEFAAALVLYWRLNVEAGGADEEAVEAAESRVHRFVGYTFFALASYVVIQAGWMLARAHRAEESIVGIVLATASLIIMPLVSVAKMRAARAIGSRALLAEAKETLACSYLSFTLLLGLLATWLAGWWWADPVAALLMVPWLVREGWEAVTPEEDEPD